MSHTATKINDLEHRRIIVKVGTNLVTGDGADLDDLAIANIANQVATVIAHGAQVIIVTSGAIAAGRHHLSRHSDTNESPSRQVLAAIGQGRLMAVWDDLFEQHGLRCAQALLTRSDLADRLRYLNARNTLLGLLDLGVIPIVNENDVVSVEEIEDSIIGDNDTLSAQVANLVDADLLLILTDTPGLHTADPSQDPTAQLIEQVQKIDESVERAADGAPGTHGTGGMRTKVEAARIATQSGVEVVIADGRTAGIVLDSISGQSVGTRFFPSNDRLESRRRYLLSEISVRGKLVIDDGAAHALENDGTSLLPVGIVEVQGTFQRGEVVQIITADGHHLASGTTNYGSQDVEEIRGLRSDRIGDTLGHEYGEEIVHRNNLVLV